MTTYTKQVLAQTLKELLKTKPLDKITVIELVEICNINRQTFYYHFQDIYDLLGWIYRKEAVDAIKSKRSYATWQQGLHDILEYVEENKTMCVNTYRSLGREHLEVFLNEVLYELLGGVVDEIAQDTNISSEQKAFVVRFYGYAFGGTLLEWIRGGMKESCEEMVHYISTTMEGNIKSSVHNFASMQTEDTRKGML